MIRATTWTPARLQLTVRDGIVDIYGVVCGGEARQASIVAAENVAGVKEVHDHLRVFETFTGTYVEGAPIERRGR